MAIPWKKVIEEFIVIKKHIHVYCETNFIMYIYIKIMFTYCTHINHKANKIAESMRRMHVWAV